VLLAVAPLLAIHIVEQESCGAGGEEITILYADADADLWRFSHALGVPLYSAALMSFSNTGPGRPSTTLRLLAVASGGLLFGSLGVGAHYFPGSYDWRYSVISQLMSPRANAAWYLLPMLGVAASICLLFPFFGELYQRVRVVSRIGASVAAVSLVVGSLTLILAVLVPQQGRRVPDRMHQLFATSAAIDIELGVLCCAWWAVKDRCPAFGGRRLKRPLALAFGLLTGLAFVGGAVSTLHPRPVVPAPFAHLWHPVFWHLGFWEWIWIPAVYLFVVGAVLL